LRFGNLYSASLLLKEHGVDLLLQGCNHGKELFVMTQPKTAKSLFIFFSFSFLLIRKLVDA